MQEKNNDFFTKYNLDKSEAFNGRNIYIKWFSW